MPRKFPVGTRGTPGLRGWSGRSGPCGFPTRVGCIPVSPPYHDKHIQTTPIPDGPPHSLPCPRGSKLFPPPLPAKDFQLHPASQKGSQSLLPGHPELMGSDHPGSPNTPPLPGSPSHSPQGGRAGGFQRNSTPPPRCPPLQGAYPTAKVGKQPSQTRPATHPLLPLPGRSLPSFQIKCILVSWGNNRTPPHPPGRTSAATSVFRSLQGS